MCCSSKRGKKPEESTQSSCKQLVASRAGCELRAHQLTPWIPLCEAADLAQKVPWSPGQMGLCRFSWADRRCYRYRCSSVLLCQRLLPLPLCWQKGLARARTPLVREHQRGQHKVAVWWVWAAPRALLMCLRECSCGLLSVADPGQGQVPAAPHMEELLPENQEEQTSCEFTPLSLCIGFVTSRGWLGCCVTASGRWHPPTFAEKSLLCCTEALIIIVFFIDSQEYEYFTEAQMLHRKFQSCRIASYL